MKTYTINGVNFSYDETLPYMDFFIKEKPTIFEVQWDKLLASLQKGELEPRNITYELVMMDRWFNDVPRKRFYRQMVKDGMSVLSGEYWFDNVPDDKVEEIFTGLLNSAGVARRFLETFLPELAEQCKSDKHPAYQHYIEP